MKKSLKKLSLNKQMISSFQSSEIKGGWGERRTRFCNSIFCITNGALNSCPPPGAYCL